MLRCSQFGACASQISGFTISHLISQRTVGKKVEFDIKLFENVTLLVVDEYSLADRNCLRQLDNALRNAKNTTELFGDVDVLFVGDPFQLGPVGSTTIHLSD